ncbi:MAG: hydroxyisourate hydrolase, partial [Proteobacteria bacterium]|nr:hydroxyisourate hydrolase [Pseudomonadota bacterium]
GMTVELYDLSGDRPRKIAEKTTGQDGMAALVASGPLQAGKYELRFQVGDYFRRMNVPVGEAAFLDFVPIRFSITDPAGHYHVPLICTPWGYTTYRGT